MRKTTLEGNERVWLNPCIKALMMKLEAEKTEEQNIGGAETETCRRVTVVSDLGPVV